MDKAYKTVNRATEWAAFEQRMGWKPIPVSDTYEAFQANRYDIMKKRLVANQEELSRLGNHGVTHETIELLSHDLLHFPIRVYTPSNAGSSNALILYLHGGGFVAGTVASEEATCTMIARDTGLPVVHAGYRLAPEWKSPTLLEDSWTARNWIVENAHKLGITGVPEVIVMGISAGGYCAASITLRERMESDIHAIKAQCLYVPVLTLPENVPETGVVGPITSQKECKDAPLLPMVLMKKYFEYLGTPDSLKKNVYHNPLLFEDRVGKALPPTHVMVCGNDPLRDEGIEYAARLNSHGIATKVDVFEGLPHYSRRFVDCPGNEEWDTKMIEGINWVRTLIK